MDVAPVAQIAAFAVFASIAVAGALGMTTTMSMFRSAIFLMSSFIGVGGLFVIMMADLLGLLQVMMYVGGMLVMALFMVLFSSDPGGAMMTSMMDLPLIEKAFSAGLKREEMGGHDHRDGHGGGSRTEGYEDHEGGHKAHGELEGSDGNDGHGEHKDEGHGKQKERESHGEHGGGHGGGGHEHEPMFIVQHKKPAAAMAAAAWLGLSALVVFRPAWPVVDDIPPQDSAEIIGDLLMSKYMIAFEGAGLMILLGIFGAVYLSRPGRYPDPTERDLIQAAVADRPAAIEEDPLEPEEAVRSGR